MEFWKKIKDEGFDDIICIDGGGSYFKRFNGKVSATIGSRQINNIITF
jgi:exopolysaccharide biosynthesis protein